MPAGTCPGRFQRHCVIGQPRPTLTEPVRRQVRQQSGSGEGSGEGRSRSPVESPTLATQDQGVTVPGVMCGREPRWEPRGRTTFQFFGLT